MAHRAMRVVKRILRIIYSMTVSETVRVLNKESGVLGLSGVSSDFRDLHAAGDRLRLHTRQICNAKGHAADARNYQHTTPDFRP